MIIRGTSFHHALGTVLVVCAYIPDRAWCAMSCRLVCNAERKRFHRQSDEMQKHLAKSQDDNHFDLLTPKVRKAVKELVSAMANKDTELRNGVTTYKAKLASPTGDEILTTLTTVDHRNFSIACDSCVRTGTTNVLCVLYWHRQLLDVGPY